MAPPPWDLTGRGYVFLFTGAPDVRGPTTPPGSRFAGGLGAVMLLDYTSSDVGPYRELLFVPGRYSLGGRRCYSISRIYVSTPESVANAFLFLCSPLAAYMTGSVLLVDGGCSLYPMD